MSSTFCVTLYGKCLFVCMLKCIYFCVCRGSYVHWERTYEWLSDLVVPRSSRWSSFILYEPPLHQSTWVLYLICVRNVLPLFTFLTISIFLWVKYWHTSPISGLKVPLLCLQNFHVMMSDINPSLDDHQQYCSQMMKFILEKHYLTIEKHKFLTNSSFIHFIPLRNNFNKKIKWGKIGCPKFCINY